MKLISAFLCVALTFACVSNAVVAGNLASEKPLNIQYDDRDLVMYKGAIGQRKITMYLEPAKYVGHFWYDSNASVLYSLDCVKNECIFDNTCGNLAFDVTLKAYTQTGAYVGTFKGSFEMYAGRGDQFCGTYTEKNGKSNEFYVSNGHPMVPSGDEMMDDEVAFGGRKLTDADLRGKSKKELRLMRNEIYARHGYIFKSKDLQDYFAQFDWYLPLYPDVNSMLTPTDNYNVKLIQRYEK